LTWSVECDDRAAKELRKLDRQAQSDILRYPRERVATDRDPSRFGKPLSGNFSGLWRYRIRDYRLICSLEDDRVVVLVLHVGHRRDVYRQQVVDEPRSGF
jgi:mRNA interferase RelE/StbE